MKHLVCTFIFCTLINYSFSQNQWFEIYNDSTQLVIDYNLLMNDFENQVKQIDSSVNLNGLQFKIVNEGGFYNPNDHTVYLNLYQTTPQWVVDFSTEIAGGKQQGEALSGLFFFGFFMPHEIAHGLQFSLNKQKADEYHNEFEANQIAMAYWKKVGKEKELEKCYKVAKKALLKLKNPIPAGEDEKKYFTKFYLEFVKDPYKYGYIQFQQIVTIYEDKSQPDFDSLIKNIIM